jgi:hemerythrin-like domain-containing protein
MPETTRRELLTGALTTGAIGIVVPNALIGAQKPAAPLKAPAQKPAPDKEPEVTATEDLMREHGVLRRALLVYGEMAGKIRQNPGAVDAAALHKAAQLFRTFGEEYHEKMLEEQHIFPVVRKMRGAAARYPDILVAQHQRGREITDYVLAVTNAGRIATNNGAPLARSLEGLVRMYQHHAAREDTIVFPAWKTNFSDKQLDELSDEFEDIEHKMFGKDGFEDAEKTIGTIEATFGLADLAQFTAPPPPKV